MDLLRQCVVVGCRFLGWARMAGRLGAGAGAGARGAQRLGGCWSFISHQSFIIYHSSSKCSFPCRRGSRDVG